MSSETRSRGSRLSVVPQRLLLPLLLLHLPPLPHLVVQSRLGLSNRNITEMTPALYEEEGANQGWGQVGWRTI